MVFPLRISPFEQSLWVDDRPAYPWNIVVRLRFRGVADRRAFDAAWQKTIDRHPMLRAKLVRRGWSWNWVPVEPPPVIQWNEHVFGQFPQLTHLNLLERGPVDAWVATNGDETEFLLHLHHANVDGLGTVQFLQDFLLLYANELGGKSPLPELAHKNLSRRHRYGLTFWKFLKQMRPLAIGILGARDFVGRVPTTLTPYDPVDYQSPLPANYPAILSQSFTKEESAAAKTAANRDNATLNDLLARDLFLALGDWREARGITADDAWLRMMVPMNLRTAHERDVPAANIMSTVFLDRQRPDLANPVSLLESIKEQMGLIKRNGLALIWVIALGLIDYIPGQMERSARRQGPVATTILTNLLRIFDKVDLPTDDGRLLTGNLRLDQFELFAPLRPWTCATFAAMHYAEQLQLCLQYDPRVLNSDEAEELLQRFMTRVRQSAGV